MKKIVKYLVGIIAIALVYLLISNFNLKNCLVLSLKELNNHLDFPQPFGF